VHKIGRFTVAQTRSLEQRLQKLQERAMVCETQREKTGLLAVRTGALRMRICMQHLHARCAAAPSIHPGVACVWLAGWLAGWLPRSVDSLPVLLLAPEIPAVLYLRFSPTLPLQDAKEIGDEFLALEK
jgi:hypothetical protein